MTYINFHTHHQPSDGTIGIVNLFPQDFQEKFPEFLFSIGLHPWHIPEVNPEYCYGVIERAIQLKNMIAIGECGVDRSVSTVFALQEECFRIQVNIAAYHSKPLIIHCVKAFSDLIRIKLDTKSEVPWIIHGYFANNQTTKELLRHGFYFSVGETMLKTSSKHEIFRSIPLNRIFLETDDLQIPIGQIYDQAAGILNIEKEKLEETILNNFNALFDSHKVEK
jgi:TatD DNase family protein